MMPASPFQIEEANFIFERNSSMIWARPGTGKTRGALLAMHDLIDSGESRRILCTAPLKVCHNVWEQERDKWEIPLTTSICTGQVPDKNKAIFSDSQCLIVNHDMLEKVLACNHGCDALVIDELSRFRHHNGTWQKAARNSGMKVFTGLTGSPAPNNYLGLYGMTRAVGLNLFGRNFDKWKRANFYPTDYEARKWAIFPGNEAPFEAIRPYTYVLDDRDVSLPTIVAPELPRLELPDDVRRSYAEMRKTSALSDMEIVAANAGVLNGKLRQISAGFIYDNAGKPRGFSSFRIDAARQLVEELQGQSVLIVYEWIEQLAMLREAFPDAGLLGGGSTNDDDTIRDWNSGKLTEILLHPASAGHGLNMAQGGNSVLWMQPTYDNEMYEQTIGRVRRRDQSSAQVYSYELLANDTLDPAVQQVCRKRGLEQEMLWKKFQ
jgi:hypothetical protein